MTIDDCMNEDGTWDHDKIEALTAANARAAAAAAAPTQAHALFVRALANAQKARAGYAALLDADAGKVELREPRAAAMRATELVYVALERAHPDKPWLRGMLFERVLDWE